MGCLILKSNGATAAFKICLMKCSLLAKLQQAILADWTTDRYALTAHLGASIGARRAEAISVPRLFNNIDDALVDLFLWLFLSRFFNVSSKCSDRQGSFLVSSIFFLGAEDSSVWVSSLSCSASDAEVSDADSSDDI